MIARFAAASPCSHSARDAGQLARTALAEQSRPRAQSGRGELVYRKLALTTSARDAKRRASGERRSRRLVLREAAKLSECFLLALVQFIIPISKSGQIFAHSLESIWNSTAGL